MSDDKTKPVLLVKKADAKKGSLWNEFANRRMIKQHGGDEIPEGDLHAIPKFQSPVDPQVASAQETNEALSDLEKEIQQLKSKDQQPTLPPQQSNEYTDPYEDKQVQNYPEYKDEDRLNQD